MQTTDHAGDLARIAGLCLDECDRLRRAMRVSLAILLVARDRDAELPGVDDAIALLQEGLS